MQSKPIAGDEDRRAERAVLLRVLDLHPEQLTDDELIRDLLGERPTYERRDATERAIGSLLGAGLLRRQGDVLSPTRAAVAFHDLLSA